MKQITRVNHIGLRVHSLDAAKAFYQKLGFEFMAGPVGPEPIAVLEHPSGINLNLILNAANPAEKNALMDEPVKRAGYTHVALEVSDAHAVANELVAKGIAISEGPIQFQSGISLFIRDQDLNVVEFHQPQSFDYKDLK